MNPEYEYATADELRAAFDDRFAHPFESARTTHVNILAIRVAGQPFALRTTELSGILTDRKIARLPGSQKGFYGLAGVRGRLVPVYRLGILLGLAPGDKAGRWLALWRGASLAICFDEMEKFHSIPSDHITAQLTPGNDTRSGEVIRIDASVRPLIGLDTLLQPLMKRTRPLPPIAGT